MMAPAPAFFEGGQCLLGQLRLFMDGYLVDARTDGLKLSLKLYHARELQLDYQQLMTEAPRQHTPGRDH